MKKQYFIHFLLLVLLSNIFLPVQKQVLAAESEIVFSTQIYKEISGTQLNAHILSPVDVQANEKRPVFVFFHGGGWTQGSPQQWVDPCRLITPKGWVIILFQYRLCTNDAITPVDCIKDAKSAIRWVRANADKLHVDPDKIVASGESAGGHLAASTAMITGINEYSDNLTISSEPNALVLFYPCLNTDADNWFKKLLHNQIPIEQTSPFHQIRKGLPPTVIFHGTKDEIVPYSTIVEFQEKMNRFGNDCTLHTFENRGHGLSQNDVPEISRLTTEFLKGLGW